MIRELGFEVTVAVQISVTGMVGRLQQAKWMVMEEWLLPGERLEVGQLLV